VGHFAIVLIPDTGRALPAIWPSKKTAAFSHEISLDAKLLDTNKDHHWNGQQIYNWHHANTLAQTYGSGAIDYLAVLPQNRFDLPLAQPGKFSFAYRDVTGQFKVVNFKFGQPISAIGLTYLAPRTIKVWQFAENAWKPCGQIDKCFAPNRMQIKVGSLRFSPN